MKRFLCIAGFWVAIGLAIVEVRAEEPATQGNPDAQGTVVNPRALNPNALSIEAFGRGMISSGHYDRMITEDFSAGVGFGVVGTQSGSAAFLIPVYANVYFFRGQNSIYATGGAAFVPNSNSVFNTTAVTGGLVFGAFPMVAQAGIGYENRTESGFLIRLTAYGMYARNFVPWFGVTLGYSF